MVNVFYGILRTQNKRFTSIYFCNLTVELGDRLLISYGVKKPPRYLSAMIAGGWNFTGSPFVYFDNFLNEYHQELQLGLYHFRTIGNRFTNHNRSEVKLYIDSAQLNLGVRGNIWATGLREVVVDFGKIMLFPVMFFVGLFIGKLRGLINKYLSARFLYCLLLSWLTALPFVSLFTASMFEKSVYLSFIWFLFEVFNYSKKFVRK